MAVNPPKGPPSPPGPNNPPPVSPPAATVQVGGVQAAIFPDPSNPQGPFRVQVEIPIPNSTPAILYISWHGTQADAIAMAQQIINQGFASTVKMY